LVAVSAVIVWLAFSIYLLAQARSSSELQWTRIAWVFGSVEAVAFAAAGALFGTAVQRDRAEQAETRAQTAEQAAGQNLQDATKGRALADRRPPGTRHSAGTLSSRAASSVTSHRLRDTTRPAPSTLAHLDGRRIGRKAGVIAAFCRASPPASLCKLNG
jgi:hypothetical protein